MFFVQFSFISLLSDVSLSVTATLKILWLNTIVYNFSKGIYHSNTCFNFSTGLSIMCLMAKCLLSVSEHSYCFWLLGFPEVLWLELVFLLWLLSKKTLTFLSLLVIPIIYWPTMFYNPHYNAFSLFFIIFFVLES